MTVIRALLAKDVRILGRSPLLVGLLVVYPIVVAVLIGVAVASPPARPTVAIYSGVRPGRHGVVRLGSARIDLGAYARQLERSVTPLREPSAAAAVAAVRSGRALAALIIPADIVSQIENLIENGDGSPTVTVLVNDHDPLERELVQSALSSRIAQVQQAVSRQVLGVASADLRLVLDGGSINLFGFNESLLGLRRARSVVLGAIRALPARSPLVGPLSQVVRFSDLAIAGLGFAGPVLGSIGSPLTIDQREVAGATTPTATYAAAIAATASLMLVTILLGAALLALERSDNVHVRLLRGLVPPRALIAEKALLAAAAGTVLTLALAAIVSAFTSLDWARFELWVLIALLGAGAFGALGVAVGMLAREVPVASLAAVTIALPVAFVSLVPAASVSGAVRVALDVVAFVFPFRAVLSGLSTSFTAGGGAVWLPGLHLALLAIAYGLLARIAVSRFLD